MNSIYGFNDEIASLKQHVLPKETVSSINFCEKTKSVKLLETYEAILKSKQFIVDEALNIITKLVLVQLFQEYNVFHVNYYCDSNEIHNNKVINFEFRKLCCYRDFLSESNELSIKSYYLKPALFIPINYVYDNNADELFFFLYDEPVIYINYLKSPYDSNDDIVDKITNVLNESEIWRKVIGLTNSKRQTQFKMILMDTEEALKSGKIELINLIKQKDIDVEIIPVSIRSLGNVYKRWMDVFINIENRMDKKNSIEFTQISSQMEQDEFKQLSELYCYCRLCEVSSRNDALIFKIQDSVPSK